MNYQNKVTINMKLIYFDEGLTKCQPLDLSIVANLPFEHCVNISYFDRVEEKVLGARN